MKTRFLTMLIGLILIGLNANAQSLLNQTYFKPFSMTKGEIQTWRLNNGDTFTGYGNYTNGNLTNYYGTYTSSSEGWTFQGSCDANFMPNGVGTLTMSDGSVWNATFQNGNFISKNQNAPAYQYDGGYTAPSTQSDYNSGSGSYSGGYKSQSRTCGYCHGNRRVKAHVGISGFGVQSRKKKCTVCGVTYDVSNDHWHACPQCKGSGRQ